MKRIRVVYNEEGSTRFNFGGKVVEFKDIFESVEGVRGALEAEGYSASVTPLKKGELDEFIEATRKGGDELVFNLCEGAFGCSLFEMNVAALLELYGMMFTGSGSLTLGVALNKAWTKDILKGAGIETANYTVFEETPVGIDDTLAFPLIVKPLCEDASVGIETDSVVNTFAGLRERVVFVLNEYNQPALVEEYIEGREFNISVIGNGKDTRVLPPSEIDFRDFPQGLPRICSYESKWIETSPLYIKSPPVCPADVTPFLRERLEGVALKAYRTLKCRDYARVDMRLKPNGQPMVLEVNPNPDISRNAGLARSARSAGMEYNDLIGEIVRNAAGRYGAGV